MTSRQSTRRVSALSAADESYFGAALREQRRFRVEQVAELADDDTSRGGSPGDAEVTAMLKRAAAHALTEIEHALARLRDGSYGTCVGCGWSIARERLEVLPAAAQCMACQRCADEGRPPVPVGAAEPVRRAQ